MKKTFKKLITILLALAMVLNMSVPAMAATTTNLGALLDSYATGSGTFTLSDNSRIFVVSDSEPSGNLLQTVQLIQRQFADSGNDYTADMDIVWGPEDYVWTGDVVLKLNSSESTIGADGYKLDVNSKTATVTAKDVDGLIYGANMLMKFFMVDGDKSISGFSAYDTPDTKERTVHLDLARKYYTAEWVKNFIRQMSWMGYNALELHLSEDGGFRADFWDDKYYTSNYQPENNFSWLCGSHVQSWVKDPYTTDPNAGDYLTTKELIDICNVAKEYHIEIIPSFDSPAHMDYITWKFEQNYKSNKNYYFSYNGYDWFASSTNGCINYTGKTGASSPSWPYYTTIDITDGTMAKAFVFALYEDMADFFKEYAGSTKFNIGADEVNLSSEYGPKWKYSLFPGYVNELNRMLNAKGYTVRMYNDFIGSTTYNQKNSKAVYSFDSNIEICYWTSDFHPTTGKWSEPVWHVKFFWENNTGTTDNWGDGGRTMYNCIQTNTYYVLREGTSGTHRDARDPNNRNWTFYGTNEQDIYNKWYPADISEKGVYTEDAADVPAEQLGGAYFLIWNDYAALSTESQVWNGALDCYDKDRYYYLFDIMASNIIKMWNADINDSVTYAKFAEVRDMTLEWFPGFTSCSEYIALSAAPDPTQAYRADHSALTAAIKNASKISNADGKYLAASYTEYEAAYTAAIQAAQTVDSKHAATETEVANAITALNNALKAAEALLVQKPDHTALTNAISEAEENKKSSEAYTEDSYTAYENAFNAAISAAKTVDSNTESAADDLTDAISKLATDIAAAEKLLVEKSTSEEPGDGDEDPEEPGQTEGIGTLVVEKLTKTARLNKKIGLKLITDADVDVKELTIKRNGKTVTPSLIVNKVQMLDGLGEVSVWLVYLPTTQAGTFNYTISYTNDTGVVVQTVEVVVK